tara:strand:+ start:287 stop:928 length:642 start_codon:yes stop_codon:yes gene_type:complete
MKRSEVEVVSPDNLGWLEYKLNKQEMDYVWKCIENKKEKINNTLAGIIKESNKLIDRGDWFWKNVLLPLVKRYAEEFDNIGRIPNASRVSHPYELSSWWVNYQRQTEFNPIHTHGGVYSFVIWMKIPYEYNQQRQLPIAQHAGNGEEISNFEFHYINTLGTLTSHIYQMRPEREGTLLFFPAKLNHEVYPFYNCDEERITVSGNVVLNTLKTI